MSTHLKFDQVVLGGGIMGLSCAWSLAKSGKRVCIIDKQNLASKAAWAAAGILVTRGSQKSFSAFRKFYLDSISLYPDWLSEISETSGLDVPLQKCSDLQCYKVDEKHYFDQFQKRLLQLKREESIDYELLDTIPKQLSQLALNGDWKCIRHSHEAYVNNRTLLEAIQICIQKSKVVTLPNTAITRIEKDSDFLRLQSQEYSIECSQMLICAGAWSDEILELLNYEAKQVPAKGQVALLEAEQHTEGLLHLGEDLYLVPRAKYLVAGATTEPGIWDEEFNEKGKTLLDQTLGRLFPKWKYQIIDSWAGIRPRPRDRKPFLGWIENQRIAICTGHYKCGISMAPLAAKCISALMDGQRPPIDLSEFDPWRKKGLQKKRS